MTPLLKAMRQGAGPDLLDEGGGGPLRSFASACFALAAVFLLDLTFRPAASADELVMFDSAAPRSHQAGEGDLGRSPIQGYLTRPQGAGPFPAAALLHSCLGLPANRRAIGAALARWGYVALFVDDFATRGIKETCAVDFDKGLADAFGALAFLSSLSYVDATRVAAVGYSQGADTALVLASSRYAASFAIPGDLKFKAAAAFYPPCQNQIAARLRMPTLILVGALDDVTPSADCERLAQRQAGEGADVRLVVYPGARHGFDNPGFTGGARLFGMWLKYDRDAAERSSAALRNFLAKTLAP
jgi:dienelactone hydrolase